MAHIKNKKTRLSIGSGEPATNDLAAAETVATTSFECLVETMDGLIETRSTEDDPEVYCDSDTTIKRKDTRELEVSDFMVEGLVDDDPASGYDAVAALCQTMIRADTTCTIVITEPNGTDKLWFTAKLVESSKKRGGAQDKQRFKIQATPRRLPLAA